MHVGSANRIRSSYAENDLHDGANYECRRATPETSIHPINDTANYACRTDVHSTSAFSPIVADEVSQLRSAVYYCQNMEPYPHLGGEISWNNVGFDL